MSLFRTEVAEAQAQRPFGTIVIASRSLSWLLAGAVLCLVALLITLLLRLDYTRRAAVSGYLVPAAGVSRVHSPIAGRLQALHVREGQTVAADTPLAVVVDERVGGDGTDARTSTARQIALREASLRRSMEQQAALFAREREGLERRIDSLAQELEQLQTQIATQRERVRYAQATRSRYRELSGQGFVSSTAEQERAEAVLEQQSRLQALERGRTSLQRERLGLQSGLASLPMRERSLLAELERELAETAQDAIENQIRAQVTVLARQAGRVSGLASEVGQPVAPERPLLTLVPEGSALEAHLFARSRDIGFVRPGQAVALRHGAFPHQRFGHQRGVIAEVSSTPLGPGDLAYPLAGQGNGPARAVGFAEPLFRIKVRLDRQTVTAHGQVHALRPGMQLDADVLLDRRSLFEWIFEAAYGLRGKLVP